MSSNASEFRIACLGPCEVDSPLMGQGEHQPQTHFVNDDQRVLVDDLINGDDKTSFHDRPTLELAGPRPKIFFNPSKLGVGIVTCGGLCPGLNDVIRGLVMVAHHRYGAARIYGFRFGYQGLCPGEEPMLLTPDIVKDINASGGTFLGSSRGPQDPAVMVRRLQELGVQLLFVIGGDGSMRGALAIGQEAARRKLPIAVVGIPKTIDNDLAFTDQSFGFTTACSTAMHAIRAAHSEAQGARNGVGLVKLMGRHSGFIACFAALAANEVNFVLIPEVPFSLTGEGGFLNALAERLNQRGHAVVVVAEGAGQELLHRAGDARDASGNVRLQDVGPFLADRIQAHLKAKSMECTLKYIDPSYIIRSVPAAPADSVFCWRLAQNAVHAGMCGKTQMVVARWHNRFVHVPMRAAISQRNHVDPSSDIWLSVLEATGQGELMS
jgi:6-phosphofructokinase 1